ncbi:TetR/AcrR family transcriptional regulator [Lactobacillus mulieris]|jgi:hypothetical protein|uniref:TetR/AcrR family transcriptional regulator n=1 Tax=Lactobacillus mulieris TaxID=2508708 RepID=A0AAP3GXP0_9LACO|nr:MULTISPECIES: TetR/AcrR family transcriptional regulator [Lactobacillus]EEU21835.1 hypothetical protein HMPREF0525_00769 [Lactobacillus jensenii 27-2-CHN]EEX24706.1 transcriptional regulator, TetR family [Lactobacillus jensenii 115-3-CHN]KAA9243426.1 TetR/AcrR family transcriptional regulator [Lactobacillus jensenii]KAA9366350.1 TetR/AcrR family transcriptional regulator [Lactobacillus jensenii]KAA9371408.1 TetR/AcrR family transcriptional regulator [Lactobacillus jensenii]
MQREEKKELNRKKIITAAKTLFLTKGIYATNVRDISKKSGISYVTMYKYFSDKNELVNLVCQELIDEAMANAYSKLNNDTLTFFEKLQQINFEAEFKQKYGPKVWVDFCSYTNNNPELTSYIEKKVNDSWLMIIRVGRKDKFIQASASDEQICNFLSLVLKLDHKEFKENIDAYWELFWYGLAGKEGHIKNK